MFRKRKWRERRAQRKRQLREAAEQQRQYEQRRGVYVNLRVLLTKEMGSVAFFQHEYDLLLAEPRVRSFEVQGTTVRFVTTAICTLADGSRYLLGKYRVEIKATPEASAYEALPAGHVTKDQPRWRVWLLETGRLDKKAPEYNNSAFPHGFCFGDREAFLQQLHFRGELFQLILSICESLAHHNSAEISPQTIAQHYRRI